MNYQKMTMEDIINWCKANGEVEWLKANALIEDANGKKPSYFVIKKKFCKKFMPDIMPNKKKPNMYDIIEAL